MLRPYVRLIPILLLVVVPLAVLTSTDGAHALLIKRQAARSACPDLALAIRPSDIHVKPSLIEHQSWLEFSVPPDVYGSYVLCFENRQWQSDRWLPVVRAGKVRFGIQTRQVNLHWVGHALDELNDPSHWELRLACDPGDACGPAAS